MAAPTHLNTCHAAAKHVLPPACVGLRRARTWSTPVPSSWSCQDQQAVWRTLPMEQRVDASLVYRHGTCRGNCICFQQIMPRGWPTGMCSSHRSRLPGSCSSGVTYTVRKLMANFVTMYLGFWSREDGWGAVRPASFLLKVQFSHMLPHVLLSKVFC